jgi:hypothetical protein
VPELVRSVGLILMGIGAILVCWELSGMKTRQEWQAEATRDIAEQQKRMLRGVVCESGACAREARSRPARPADVTVPLTVVHQ